MKVLIANGCQAWEDPFAELLQQKGKIFREVKGRKTFRFEIEGKGYFAKVHSGVGWREIFKNLLSGRLPILSAANEWKAIQRLSQLNVPTMKLAGYGCEGFNPATLKSFIITEELTSILSLEDFCRDWKVSPPTFILKTAIIKKVANIARTLHQNGVNHRDFYACHFLLDLRQDLNADNILLYVIDLHRAQLRTHTPERWIIKDISGLYFSSLDFGLTRGDLFRFLRIYFDQPLREILREHHTFLSQVEKRAIKLYRKIFIKQGA
jgi:heptose I phosphotransferase